MAIRLGSIFKAIKKVRDVPSVKNISKFLHDDPDAINLQLNEKFLRTLKDNPQVHDQIQTIDTGLKSGFVSSGIDKKAFGSVLEGDPTVIKNWYGEVDSLKKSRQTVESIEKLGGLKESGGIKRYVKEGIRAAEYRYKQAYPIMENNIKKFAIDGVPDNLKTDAAETFDYLMSKPGAFEAKYRIKQDDFLRSLLGEESPTITNDPVLSSMNKAFKQFDDQVLGFAQDLGVPVGQLDDYVLPFQIPKDAPYFLGANRMKSVLEEATDLRPNQVAHLVKRLFQSADDTTQSTGMGFAMRDIKFKSAQHELNFYRIVNQLNEGAPMLRLALDHKQRLVKKASLVAQWGTDPVRTFNKAINHLLKGEGKMTVDEADKIKKNFQFLLDAYDGKMNITNHSVEQTRQAISLATSVATGSVSSGFVRNLVTDFNFNVAATGNALYNPKYGLGSAALGTVQDFGGVVARYPKMFAREKGVVKELLEAMEFATSMDSLSHHGLLNFEDIYDVTLNNTRNTLGKTIDFLKKTNDLIYTVSGQHSIVDVRRFRHLLSAQNMWEQMLRRYNYDEWLSKADKVGKKQIEYLDASLNIGRQEFGFLSKAPRLVLDREGKKFSILSRDSILETSDEIANKYKKPFETAKDFKTRVANSWQNMMYLSTQDAAPIPLSSDSISPHMYGSGSWVRLLVSIPLKFGDVAQSQWLKAAERIALTTYGNKNKLVGFDKSIAKYMYATAIYTGSAVGVQWINDMVKGKKPTDMTNPKNVFRAMAGSGVWGFTAQLGSSIMNLYGPQTIGTAFPASKPFKSGKKLARTLEKNPELFWYQLAEEARSNSGIGNIWYARGMANKALQSMLLSPSQQTQMRDDYQDWIEKSNRREKEQLQEIFNR